MMVEVKDCMEVLLSVRT